MKAYQMKITIKNSHPPIWRRFIVPAELSFSQLSIVLNEVMGWCGYHLFSFEFNDIAVRLEEADPYEEDWEFGDFDVYEASEIMLEAFLDEEKRFTYTYDFGDDWTHSVVIEKIIEDYEFAYPSVLKFKGDTPYEDCGGIYGYYQLLQTLENPSDPEYENLKEWTENHFTRKYDLDEVNSRLQCLKLTNKKSKPVCQAEIYEDLGKKAQGLKRIQGIKQLDYDDSDDISEEDIAEINNLLEEYQKRLHDLKLKYREESLNGTSLQVIYSDYTKEILVNIAKLHHIKGYSKYNKERLIEFLIQNVLDKDVMSRYFTFLDDKELDIIEKASLSESVVDVSEEDIDRVIDLVLGGYGGLRGMAQFVVPKEVTQMYHEIRDSEWRKARKKALELFTYLNGAADLYGVCPMSRALEIYTKYTGKHVEEMTMYSFCELIPDNKKNFIYDGVQLVHKFHSDKQRLEELKKEQKDKPFYMPTKKEIELLGREDYLPFDYYMEDLCEFAYYELDLEHEDAEYLCKQIQRMFRAGLSVDDVVEQMEEDCILELPVHTRQMRKYLSQVREHTRKRADRGNLPVEPASEKGKPESGFIPFNHQKENIVDFPVDVKKKIYPNDPCPCGSGKKYKKCCGRNKK
ncbi:MAG: SEC-C metal-binding domain-containing protein [Eubacteriales bacterium]|nr:SEC-C metal-binding domain-containing protein [Eubacteriales bacterium]